MRFVEITYNKIKDEIENFLSTEYNRTGVTFSPASPFGQLLEVIQQLHQLSFLYLKNTIKQFDIGDPTSLNSRTIRNAAIFAGHIPSRPISASGTIKMKVKPSIDIASEIGNSKITIPNNIEIKNKTNGLKYNIVLNSDNVIYDINNGTEIFFNIIQGEWREETVTGTGEDNQTYNISPGIKGKDIEQNNVEVYVNGVFYDQKKHILDITYGQNECVVRTGFDGGIDLLFGNGNNPPISSTILVRYLLSDGAKGSIFRRTPNDWKFVDSVYDGNNNLVSIDRIFDIEYMTDINFGADAESVEYTKSLLPIVSNNFVLGTPEQYAYEVKKLGVFSHVNAYDDNGVIKIVATPNVALFRNKNVNYFNVGIDAFYLDEYEKTKISRYLRSGGNIMLSKSFVIESPRLSYYSMDIMVITYSDSIEENVNSEILSKISDYMLNLNKLDRIPKSELISEIMTINDVYSVMIDIKCKKNEDYHRENTIANENNVNLYNTLSNIDSENYYDKNKIIGLDSVMGDIIFEPNEYPVIRGGFYLRNGIYVSDSLNSKGYKAINIYHKEKVDSNKRR